MATQTVPEAVMGMLPAEVKGELAEAIAWMAQAEDRLRRLADDVRAEAPWVGRLLVASADETRAAMQRLGSL